MRYSYYAKYLEVQYVQYFFCCRNDDEGGEVIKKRVNIWLFNY